MVIAGDAVILLLLSHCKGKARIRHCEPLGEAILHIDYVRHCEGEARSNDEYNH
ncbi:hypothetical protein AGMMS50239_40780 [Bacteroidia bacterium]|nr:hypothetical protein AGMMS50239_40780 [Bacteroidia bacterium]